MNTGLIDAVVLGQALAAIAGTDAAPSELDRYADLRRPAAAEVLTLASRLTNLATVRPALLRALRNVALRALNRIGPFKARLALQLSGISRRERARLAVPAVEAEPSREPLALAA